MQKADYDDDDFIRQGSVARDQTISISHISLPISSFNKRVRAALLIQYTWFKLFGVKENKDTH